MVAAVEVGVGEEGVCEWWREGNYMYHSGRDYIILCRMVRTCVVPLVPTVLCGVCA